MAVIAVILGIVSGVLGLAIGLGLDMINLGPKGLNFAFHDLTAVKLAAVVIPLSSVLGGIVAKAKPLIGGVLMVLGASGMAIIFDIDYPAQVAIAGSAIGAMMAIYAGSREAEASTAPAE